MLEVDIARSRELLEREETGRELAREREGELLKERERERVRERKKRERGRSQMYEGPAASARVALEAPSSLPIRHWHCRSSASVYYARGTRNYY